MNFRPRRILRWVLYPLFYVVAFVLCAYITFPFDTVRDRVVLAFAEDQRKTGGDQRLEIDKLSMYWLSGVEASGVRLISAPSPKPGSATSVESQFYVEQATARVALLPLLLLRVTINFSAKVLGGKLQGSTRKGGADRSLSLDLSDLEVGQIGPLVELIGVPLSGTLEGKVNLTLPDGKISKANGAIDLVIRDFSVGDGVAKIRDLVALPRLVIGDLELSCEIEEGKVDISKLSAAGSDLDFFAEGRITLRERLGESLSDLNLRFKFSDKYRAKDDKTKALFGTPGSSAPALFELADAKIRQSKRQDGFYGWRASGLLQSLRFDPAPAGPQKSPRGATPGTVRGGTK